MMAIYKMVLNDEKFMLRPSSRWSSNRQRQPRDPYGSSDEKSFSLLVGRTVVSKYFQV
jgi:hypothetical protein